MAGNLYGKIKGIISSTTCNLEIPTQKTLNLSKNSGTDYWYYSTGVDAGNYDVTARDTTAGAGGNNQTKPVTVTDMQWVELDFDIS